MAIFQVVSERMRRWLGCMHEEEAQGRGEVHIEDSLLVEVRSPGVDSQALIRLGTVEAGRQFAMYATSHVEQGGESRSFGHCAGAHYTAGSRSRPRWFLCTLPGSKAATLAG
jgi:hypothetical protein